MNPSIPLAALLGAIGPAQLAATAHEPAPSRSGEPARLLFGDYDSDGLSDAIAVAPGGELRLFRNLGDGSFEDVSAFSGLCDVRGASLLLWQDYDGDRRPDLFVGTSCGPQRLFRNLGDGSFGDVTEASGLAGEGCDLAAQWFDYDGDGRLDLHLEGASGVRLYRALSDGRFEALVLPVPAPRDAPSPRILVTSPSEEESPVEAKDASTRSEDAASDQNFEPRQQRVPGSHGSRRVPNTISLIGVSTSSGTQALAHVLPTCTVSIKDQANPGMCLRATSVPTPGMLFPPPHDGGVNNLASGTNSFIGGGQDNLATEGLGYGGGHTTVGGGQENTASGAFATVGGGGGGAFRTKGGSWISFGNAASGEHSTIGGGLGNTASGRGSTVAGGGSTYINGIFQIEKNGNTASGDSSTVGGGSGNTAQGDYATVSGGGGAPDLGYPGNTATGVAATVPGGRSNTAQGDFSLATGLRAKANHDGAFVWGDSQDVDKTSSAADEFNVYAEGGARFFAVGTSSPSLVVDSAGKVGIGTSTPSEELTVTGDICATGTIGACSDARFKTAVEPVTDALALVNELRAVRFDWDRDAFPERNFGSQRQLGFIAQELAEVVPEVVSRGNDGYFSVDYGKLTPLLVRAIQEQGARLADKDGELADLREANSALVERVARLERLETELASLRTSVLMLAEAR